MAEFVSFAVVKKMLEECAPGFKIRKTDHFRRVFYGKRIYPALPKLKKIYRYNVLKMVRSLGINQECADKFILVRTTEMEEFMRCPAAGLRVVFPLALAAA